MSFFRKAKRAAVLSRLAEETLYAAVLDELTRGIRRDGLWGKALADSDGDRAKAESLYIRYRARSMRDELEIANQLAGEEDVGSSGEKGTVANNEAIRKAQKVNALLKELNKRGFAVEKQSDGTWIVCSPNGACSNVANLSALFDYAKDVFSAT